MEDGEILKLFLERSEQAVTELSEKYGAALLRLALNITGSREDAEECVNSALMRVWSSVPPARPEMLRAYALKITRNIALNRIKYNSAEKREGAALCLEELAEVIPSGKSVESTIEDKELGLIMDAFVRRLGETDRIIFVRRYFYLEPTAQIAKRLGMSGEAVRARLTRLRRKLKKQLSDNGVTV